MHLVDQKELKSFLTALGLEITQFETAAKPKQEQAERKQDEQPKVYENMNELVARVIKQNYARLVPQRTNQTHEQTALQQILIRLEKLEQNERKPSADSSGNYINDLEGENERLGNKLAIIANQWEITKIKVQELEEKNKKLFNALVEATAEIESSKSKQGNCDSKILAELVYHLKEENSDLLRRYEKIYKNNLELIELNKNMANAINNKPKQYSSGIAMASDNKEISKLVDENKELKQKLIHLKSLAANNSDRMSIEFRSLNDEIHNLKLEMNILGEENIKLIEHIEELENEIN